MKNVWIFADWKLPDAADTNLMEEIGFTDVEAVQWLLVERGLNLGDTGPERNGVDGKWGSKSRVALNEYRISQGLKTRGDFVLEDVTSLVNNLRKRLPI